MEQKEYLEYLEQMEIKVKRIPEFFEQVKQLEHDINNINHVLVELKENVVFQHFVDYNDNGKVLEQLINKEILEHLKNYQLSQIELIHQNFNFEN